MSAEPERVGDVSDDVEDMEDEEESGTNADLKSQILRRPDLLAALQGRLHAEMMQVRIHEYVLKSLNSHIFKATLLS